MAKSTVEERNQRGWCIDFALRVKYKSPPTPHDIITVAKEFHSYIEGADSAEVIKLVKKRVKKAANKT